VVTTGAVRRAKLQSKCQHPDIFLQGGCTSCRPTNSVKALKEKGGQTRTAENRNSAQCMQCNHIVWDYDFHFLFNWLISQ